MRIGVLEIIGLLVIIGAVAVAIWAERPPRD